MSSSRASLNALRAFETTARLGSMTAAATELAVTHGAISHHVRFLEETYGVPLFRRDHNSLELTFEGARLAESLSTAFNLIEASIEQLKPGPLTVSCSSAIMMRWLLPRITAFHSHHPNMEVHFNLNYDRIDFVLDKVSIAIRNSTISPPRDVVLRELSSEWIGPICSPLYFQGLTLDHAEVLQKAQLLWSKTRPQGWQEWTTSVNLAPCKLHGDGYEHFYLLIQAVLCGFGVAVVPAMLVIDEVSSGGLLAPFGFVQGPRKLLLWIAPHLRSRPDVRAMANWLTVELNKTAEDCAAVSATQSVAPRLTGPRAIAEQRFSWSL
jgi:DNA-binding transcriptional LysR family regulator